MLESCENNLFVQVVTKQGWRFPTSDFLSRALRHAWGAADLVIAEEPLKAKEESKGFKDYNQEKHL